MTPAHRHDLRLRLCAPRLPPRHTRDRHTRKVILGVSEWGVWGLWGGVCPNLLHGRSVAGSGASGAQGPDPILVPWEDRSGPAPGVSVGFRMIARF